MTMTKTVGRHMRWVLWAMCVAWCAACSDEARPEGGADASPDPDASVADAAAPPDANVDAVLADAAPQGTACRTRPVEVARIVGADIFPGTVAPAYLSSPVQTFYAEDVDGDNDVDLLTLEFGASTTSGYEYRIRVFPREGASFGAARESKVTLPRYGVEFDRLGDFNGDGRKDLLIGYTTELPRSSYVYPVLQSPDGSFTLKSRVDVAACRFSDDERHQAIAVVDIDRDGKDDVLSTATFGGLGSAPEGLSLLRGADHGLESARCVMSATVTTPGLPVRLWRAMRIVPGDYDGDGDTDLFATFPGNDAQFFFSEGPSTFKTPEPAQSVQGNRWFLERVPGRARDRVLSVYVRGKETQIFSAHIGASGPEALPRATLPVGSPSYEVLYGFAASDFNGDGLTDVIAIGQLDRSNGPVPFSIACDRGSYWERGEGELPEGTRILRAIDHDDSGARELVARVGADIVVFRMD